LSRLLDEFGGRGVVIGGVASSLIAEPRFTVDVDAVVLTSVVELPRLLAAAAHAGFSPRQPDAEAFARQHRVVLLRHDSSGANLDLAMGIMPFEVEMVNRATRHKFDNVVVWLPAPEDLIVLKAVARRPKDFIDIESIARAHPDLDLRRVRRWVKEYAAVLEAPELPDLVDQTIRRGIGPPVGCCKPQSPPPRRRADRKKRPPSAGTS
jgi:predicted nucleotidyltransferase